MPTRVVRIITRMNIGGPSIQAAALSDRLRSHGFETTLIHGRLGQGEGDMSYLLPPSGVDVRYLNHLQRPIAPAGDVKALWQIYRVLCRVQPRIVHTHMAKAGALGRLATIAYNRSAGRRAPARIVHTYHGHVLEGYFSPRKTAAFIRAERMLAGYTDRIIAISPTIREELLTEYQIGTGAQYAVVPLGFDLERFRTIGARERAAARVALELPPDVPVMATVGRLTAIKQHELFIDAARTVVETHPSAIFLIAGDGERRDELESTVRRLRLSGNVRFLGWRRDLETINAAIDVFVLTSRNEGTPVALIEAMASGVPGVSTDVGGVRDVIASPDLGVLVAPDRPQDIAAGIRELLADDARRTAMGERARTHVLSRFTIDRLVTDIATLYRELVAE